MAALAPNSTVQWDPLSSVPLPHMNFILRHFLPIRFVQVLQEAKEEILQIFGLDSFRRSSGIISLPAGSSFEGLNLPKLMKKGSSGKYDQIISSDIDLMLTQPFLSASEDPADDANFLMRETEHPGYVMLEVVNAANPETDLMTCLGDPGVYYLNGSEFMSLIMDGCGGRNDNPYKGNIETHGPALMYGDGVVDVIVMVNVKNWPNMATEWITRPKMAGWPSKLIIEEIVSKGCHVVGTSHPKAMHADLVWRLSFSNAECILADNLTDVQKQCYLLLKTLHLSAFKQPQAIVSYHLKTVFYWVLEEIPKRMWTQDGISSMLIYLLDKLLYFLTRHNLPSYFIPANNLVDAIPVDTIREVKRKVAKVRQDLVGTLFHFNKVHKFMFWCRTEDMDKVMKPVIDHIPIALLADDDMLIEAFELAGLSLMYIHITEYEMSGHHETTYFDNIFDIGIEINGMVKQDQPLNSHTEVLLVFLKSMTAKLKFETVVECLNHMLYRFPNSLDRVQIQKMMVEMFCSSIHKDLSVVVNNV